MSTKHNKHQPGGADAGAVPVSGQVRAEQIAGELYRMLDSDEVAHTVGHQLACDLGLRRSRAHSDRWQLASGTFTSAGLARRVSRVMCYDIAEELGKRERGAK